MRALRLQDNRPRSGGRRDDVLLRQLRSRGRRHGLAGPGLAAKAGIAARERKKRREFNRGVRG